LGNVLVKTRLIEKFCKQKCYSRYEVFIHLVYFVTFLYNLSTHKDGIDLVQSSCNVLVV